MAIGNIETEKKFSCKETTLICIEGVLSNDISPFKTKSRKEVGLQLNTYYDTKEFLLYNLKCSLRRRKTMGEKYCYYTIKLPVDNSKTSSLTRQEFELKSLSVNLQDVDISKFINDNLMPYIKKNNNKLTIDQLDKSLLIETLRAKSIIVEEQISDFSCEICIDRIKYHKNTPKCDKTVPDYQIEIELLSGEEEKLTEFFDILQTKMKHRKDEFKVENISKYEKGICITLDK